MLYFIIFVYSLKKLQTMEEQELKLSEEAKMTLRESTKWMKFMGIISYICASFMALGGITVVCLAIQRPQIILTGIIYIISSIIYFVIASYLTRAARNGKMAILSNNNQALTDFFSSNKSFWKFLGILTIIGLSIAAISIIIAIIAIGFSSFAH